MGTMDTVGYIGSYRTVSDAVGGLRECVLKVHFEANGRQSNECHSTLFHRTNP